MKDSHLKKISDHLTDIPDGWSVRPLSKVVRIANGQVDPKKPEYRVLPHVGPENIESGTGRILNVQPTETLGLTSGKYLFDNNALVYSKIRPNLNKVCQPGFDGLCSADAYPMWAIAGLSTTYLCYYMLSELFVRQAVACSMRTGMPKINREDLNSLWVICPPEKDQKVICEILKGWDHSIDLTENLITTKEERRKWLIQQLLAGKKRLPGFNDTWNLIHLRDHLREVSIRNKGTFSRVLSVTNDRGFVLPEEQFSRTVASSDLSNYKIVKRGQFAYNPSRINVGSWAMLDNFDEGVISPMYVVFKTNKELSSHFLAYWMRSGDGQQRINLQAQGSVRDTVSFDALSSIKVALPSLEEQAAIVHVLKTADRELDLLRNQLDALKEQKKGLMQQLLTGKRLVKFDN